MRCPNPNISLHLEIIDFYKYIKPKSSEIKSRLETFHILQNILESKIENSKLYRIGSFATHLNLPNASMDVAIVNSNLSTKQLLKKCAETLRSTEHFEILEMYKHSKTPMIKFQSKKSLQLFEMTFNDLSGLIITQETMQAIQMFPEMPYLIFILKMFLRQRRLNNAYTGGLGSFLLFALVLHFCREYRAQFQWKFGAEQVGEISLGQFLLHFFYYYSSEFNFRDTLISISKGPNIHRKLESSNSLCVMFPLEVETDIGLGCLKFVDIVRIWKNRFNFIANTPRKVGQSMLGCLINPQDCEFSTFEKN